MCAHQCGRMHVSFAQNDNEILDHVVHVLLGELELMCHCAHNFVDM